MLKFLNFSFVKINWHRGLMEVMTYKETGAPVTRN